MDRGGVFEKSDLQKIFEIQNGQCYFTGEHISLENRTYSIDHLTPVCNGGSFWPRNIALVTKDTNQNKHYRTKAQYFNVLAKQKGEDWVKIRKEVCRDIDKRRREIDKLRRLQVSKLINRIEKKLFTKNNNDLDISLSLENDQLTLNVDGVVVIYPKGFIRKKDILKTNSIF